MMRSEPRDKDPKVNMVLRSGTTIGEDKGNLSKKDTGVGKETYLEARESSAEVFTPGSRDQHEQDRDPSMLTTFLETCIKLIRNNRAVRGFQELINSCMGMREPSVV